MSNVKITELPVLTYALGSDVLPVVSTTEGYTTSQITVANLANSIASTGITGSLLMSGSIIPAVESGSYTSSFSLGSATNAWKDLWVSNGTINFLDGAGTNQGTLSSTAAGLSMGALSAATIYADAVVPGFYPNGTELFLTPTDPNTLSVGPVLMSSGPTSATSGPIQFDYYTVGFKQRADPFVQAGPILTFTEQVVQVGGGTPIGSTWVSINDNTYTGNLTTLRSPLTSSKYLLEVSGSFITKNASLGTSLSSDHYIVGRTTLSGSISMSLDTGTPSDAVTPTGFYKAAINGASHYIPYYT